MEENNQELIFKLSIFEQQIRQLQQQISAVDEGIIELETLDFGIDELKTSKGKEILAPVGRGIFIKAKVESEDLTVDVGGRVFVKKSVEDTQETIKKQIEKLKEVKDELNKNLEEIGKEVERVMKENQ
ncbi:prefoldin subunit alpha [Candidatus Pacearchaeota archaeon]|nr:prefoldin subunit alpha [Candidatus Pacearchaeota archaeon]